MDILGVRSSKDADKAVMLAGSLCFLLAIMIMGRGGNTVLWELEVSRHEPTTGSFTARRKKRIA